MSVKGIFQQLPAVTGKIIHQHFPAKSFSVFDYALSIMDENPVYGAHIVAARTTKITEHVVFDGDRVRTPLCKTVVQLL